MPVSRRSEGETMRAVIFATIASLLAVSTLQAEDTAPPNADERRKRIAASLSYGRREESHDWLPLVATRHRAPVHLPS